MSIFDHPLVWKESINVWVRNKLNKIDAFANWKILQTGGAIVESRLASYGIIWNSPTALAVGETCNAVDCKAGESTRIASGGKAATVQSLVESNGYVFLYNDAAEQGKTYLCVSESQQNALCFRIVFDDETREISIDVSYSSGCSTNKLLPKSTGTLAMLGAILKLIFTRDNISIFTSIKLTDNSTVDCVSFIDGSRHEIQLMNMNFICTGCTWYASLIPMFLAHKQDEIEYYADKEKILNESFTWDDFVNKLPMHVKSIVNAHIQFNDESTRTHPAYTILNKIRKDTDRYHCIFFTKYMSDFLRAFDVNSMHGKKWCIPLRNGRIIACATDPTGSCKHPEKGWLVNDALIEWVNQEEYTTLKDNVQVKTPRITHDANSKVRTIYY